MSVHDPMSRIPVRNGPAADSSGHRRTMSEPSKLEQMQMALQARLEKEKQAKLAKEKEEHMINLYNQEQDRQNRQINKYGYSNKGSKRRGGPPQGATNVGGVRGFFQERRQEQTSGKGIRGKPPLPYQKNSAGRDRGNPLAPLNHRSPAQSDYGVLGQGGSPLGIRHSPKPQRGNHRAARPYGTPNDSGNESSGYEDQNHNYSKTTNRIKRQSRMYQASSEEDVDNAHQQSRKTSSFQQWKQQRQKASSNTKNNKVPRSTALHNGYYSDGGSGKQSDFQKWQGDMDKQREDRLAQYAQNQRRYSADSPVEDQPTSHRSGRGGASHRSQLPSSRRPPQYEDSAGEDDDEAAYSSRTKASNISAAAKSRHSELEAELKRKERDLLAMIQKQQDELESMKRQRAREEAEYEQQVDQEWLDGFVKDQKRQVKEERHKREREAEQERKRKARMAEERVRQASRHSNVVENETKHMPSPPPADVPKPFASRKPRRVVKAPPAASKQAPPLPQPEEPSFYDTSGAADFYANAIGSDPDAAPPVQLNLTPCSMCGRKFAADRLAKHQVACQRAQQSSSKRKVFDPVKMRTAGTDMAKYTNNPKPQPKKSAKKGDWRKKHEDFINTIRYAKKVTEIEKTGGDLKDLPPPPRTENAHYTQCPYCERRFAPDTAERHIPKCKDIKARPKPVGAMRRGR